MRETQTRCLTDALARIIHEGFYCIHRDAATTSLTAGGLVAQSVTILFQVCLLPSRLRAPVSHGVSAVSSLDWARDPERVEESRILVNNVGSWFAEWHKACLARFALVENTRVRESGWGRLWSSIVNR
jgi:hypothetical protein